jgi:hypothetical protein
MAQNVTGASLASEKKYCIIFLERDDRFFFPDVKKPLTAVSGACFLLELLQLWRIERPLLS